MTFLEKLEAYGVGRRKLDDPIFTEKPPARLGVIDIDEENLCHEVFKTVCNIPGCGFTSESILDYDSHYNSTHRYTCMECKKVLPSPHFLDLHLQENHDSFFAVMAERKPSYCCFIEECEEKFATPELRHDHCVQIHKLPKDFRFEQKPKQRTKKGKTKPVAMETDIADKERNKFVFNNSKQKTFAKYTGRRFINSHAEKREDMEISVNELKECLPE